MRPTKTLLTTCLLLTAAAAAAQAPDPAALDSLRTELCARDSLYLVSPEGLTFTLQEEEGGTQRFGMLIGWDDIATRDATCFALRGVDTLDLDLEASGGFGDRVDRLLRFTVVGGGEIGADQSDQLLLSWRNVGPSTYGNLAGYINLANNGGILEWDATAGEWLKRNTGLPVTWRQVNVLDLAVAADGTMYAALSSGETANTGPRGVYRHDGVGWSRFAPETIDASLVVTSLAVDADDPDRVAIGTLRTGFFVTTDGGATFTQWTANLKPDVDPQPSTYRTTALAWQGSRLLAAVRSLGLFVSEDNGATFVASDLTVPDNLDKDEWNDILPEVNQIVTDPNDPDRVLAALRYHGVYESNDGGMSWRDLYGDLLVPVEDDAGAWVRSAVGVTVDPADPQVIVMGVEQWGLYRTTNGGLNWTLVGEDVQPEVIGSIRTIGLLADPAVPGRMYALEDGWSLLASDDAGATWYHFATQPSLASNLSIAARPGGDGGDFLIGSWKGGLYVPGTEVAVSETYSSETSSDLRGMDLGLNLRFDGGDLADGEAFELVGQTFQGWAVWRSTTDAPDDMTLIGKYDRVNPESCIEGFCGDLDFQPVAQCYHSTRAACFRRDEDGRVWFFDSEIYNAFRYNYAVTTFDYANTAEVTPASMSRTMIVSPRWDGDELSIFTGAPYYGDGNRRFKQINRSAAPARGGEGIYVYPNPLRNDAGLPGEEGRTVIFTNLPPGARVRVFTTAGDDVVNLGPDNLNGGQIRWRTWNRDKEPVAAGVYLYQVEAPGREEHWGRLVIIR